MQEKKIKYNNKTIFYRTKGEGPVVLLVHGFGEDGNIWKNQFEAFNNFKLIIPDLPGSGQSELTEEISMESLAETLKLIIDNELDTGTTGYGQKVIMIGHSMGGYVTLAFAEKYTGLLQGFGLFHSTAYKDNEAKVEIRKKGISFIEQHGAFEFLKTSIPNLYSPVTKENKFDLIEQQISTSHNFLPSALVSYYNAMIERKERIELLKTTTLPVLFILGKYDTAIPLKDGLEQCHLPNFSYIHVLDRSGHMGMIEEPEKSNHILSAYLNSIST